MLVALASGIGMVATVAWSTIMLKVLDFLASTVLTMARKITKILPVLLTSIIFGHVISTAKILDKKISNGSRAIHS